MGSKLSIYVFEKPVINWLNGKPEYYHSSLALVDETKQTALDCEEFTPIEELHFAMDGYAEALSADVYTKKRHVSNEMSFVGYIGGDEMVIRKLWNQALRVGVAVRKAAPTFNLAATEEWSFNCRSGVEAALEAMGFPYNRVKPKEENEAQRTLPFGLDHKLLSYVERFVPPAPDESNLAAVLAEGQRLSQNLAPEVQ